MSAIAAHLEVLGVDGAQQDAPLVAGTNDADADRAALGLFIAVVETAQAAGGDDAGGQSALQEIAPTEVARNGAEVLLAGSSLLGSEIHIE